MYLVRIQFENEAKMNCGFLSGKLKTQNCELEANLLMESAETDIAAAYAEEKMSVASAGKRNFVSFVTKSERA